MTAHTMEQEAIGSIEIRKQTLIAAPIEIAFEALLEEIGPEAQMPDGKSLALRLEAWPGGRWFRDLGNNTGHLWGHVQVIKPPTLLEICGPMAMSYPATNHIQYRLQAEPSEAGAGNSASTRLTLLHRAVGLIAPEHRDGMDEGWGQWIESIRARAQRKASQKPRASR